MSEYQKNITAEKLEIIAMEGFRAGDDWAYISAMLHNANKAYQYGFEAKEIENIVVSASKQVK